MSLFIAFSLGKVVQFEEECGHARSAGRRQVELSTLITNVYLYNTAINATYGMEIIPYYH